MHGMGHLLEIIHGLLKAKTGSLMLYFLYVVASLKTSLEFFLSFHVGLLVLDWFIGTCLLPITVDEQYWVFRVTSFVMIQIKAGFLMLLVANSCVARKIFI